MAKLYFSADKAIEAEIEQRAASDGRTRSAMIRRIVEQGIAAHGVDASKSFTRGDLATLRGALETQIEHEQKTMDSLSSSDPYAMPLTEAIQECRVRRDKCEDLLKKIETIEARAEP